MKLNSIMQGSAGNKFIVLCVMLLLIFLLSCAGTRPQTHITDKNRPLLELQRKIDALLQDSLLSQTRTGIKIVSLDNNDVLYSRDSQILFHPASNMKLLTTATALKELGVDFLFETRLLADSAVLHDSLISGNIYLKGYGNPDLLSEDLRNMVLTLREKGIRRITGDLICDESYFDDLYWGSGWMWDDASAWYWAPITPLTVNDNCVIVTVKPGKKLGDSLIVEMDPPTRYMKIINQGITVDSTDTLLLDKFKVEREWKHPSNTIYIEGGYSINDPAEIITIDVVDGSLYTGTLFTEIMEEQGIEFAGHIVKGIVPDSAIILVDYPSKPLSLVVYNTNKISDNLSAELILKTIGAEIKGPPGTASGGISIIYRTLDTLGVDSTTYNLADGSGVSRYNLITPDLLIALLKGMDRDFRIQAEFKASLPIAAMDGTLEDRMGNSAAAGKLRAKTGSLSGVSALSGYTVTADGEKIAFSIIMEHFVTRTSGIRKIQDSIGELISSFSRHPGETMKKQQSEQNN
jgi:D-alanyl-D-alanine carboxypeptidase/D-alanyl-D-alanine-endopeptidase (penicillin-binding protein 4)